MQIARLSIKNYRSLKNVTIPGLTSANVFHGPNNSGKSNILLALHTIFSRKWETLDVSVPGETSTRPSRRTAFWYGTVKSMGNSFFRDSSEPIQYSLNLTLLQAELADLPDAATLTPLISAGHDIRVDLSGQIERHGDDANMLLDRVRINGKDAFIRLVAGGVNYLPSLGGSPQAKENVIRALLDSFNNCVYVVPSSRYLATEAPSDDKSLLLAAPNFKNWLHNLSLSKEGYDTFTMIRRGFNEPPFVYGELSFLRDPELLEIMVDDGSHYRMPIESKGTGVQQILILLSYIAASGAKIIGVEEPELNLSFSNQDAIVTKLMSLVVQAGAPPYQLFLTSHSDHVGSRSDLKQYHVSHDGSETAVRRFTAADRAALFPRSKGKRTQVSV